MLNGSKSPWKKLCGEEELRQGPQDLKKYWEGNHTIFYVLQKIRSVDIASGGSANIWLSDLLEALTQGTSIQIFKSKADINSFILESFAEMIWKYGGLEFLIKLAKLMDTNNKEVCEIIRFVVGMNHGM